MASANLYLDISGDENVVAPPLRSRRRLAAGVATFLFAACVVGVLVRHKDKVGTELDSYELETGGLIEAKTGKGKGAKKGVDCKCCFSVWTDQNLCQHYPDNSGQGHCCGVNGCSDGDCGGDCTGKCPSGPNPSTPAPPAPTRRRRRRAPTPAPVRRRAPTPTPPVRRRAPTPTPPAPTPTPVRRRAPTPTPPSGGGYTVGGYAMKGNAKQLSDAVCGRGWRILAGAFEASLSAEPPAMEKNCDNWLVLGGQDVGGARDNYDPAKVVKWMNTYNYDNVDFDLESVLDASRPSTFSEKIPALIKGIRSSKPGVKFQITPFGSPYGGGKETLNWLKTHHEDFDSIALMLYGTYESEGGTSGWKITDPIVDSLTYKYLKDWLNEDAIPNSKLMIGITHLWDHTNAMTPGWVINQWQQIVIDKGLKGLFFWNGMNTNFNFYKSCIEDFGAKCPSGVPDAPPNGNHCHTNGMNNNDDIQQCKSGPPPCVSDGDCTKHGGGHCWACP